MNHLDTVRAIYAAFQQGDVPAILGRLTADVRWEAGSAPSSVPWLLPRVGRDAVAGFFESLAAIRLDRFEPKEMLAGDRVVVVLLDVAFTVLATGRRVVEQDEIHVWRFGDDGLVRSFRHGADSHGHWLAAQPGRG